MSEDNQVETQPEALQEAVAAPEAVIETDAVESHQETPEAPKKTPWYMTRISEESAAKQREREAREAAERQLREANEIIERMRRGDQTQETRPRDEPRTSASNRDEEIRAEAQRQLFYRDTLDIKNRGVSQYGAAFNETLGILGTLGVTNDTAFISDVMAVNKEHAHEILTDLAKDPERALALAGLDSRQRVAELTRMTISKTSPAPKEEAKKGEPARAVSKAPPPAPSIQAAETKVKDWRRDDASEEEFHAGWLAKQRERAKDKYGVR